MGHSARRALTTEFPPHARTLALSDVFELQDTVAVSVAGVIEPTLQAAEMRRSADRPTNDLTAYDLYLRALAPIRSGEWDKERYLEVLDLLSQAIERDPRYGPALAAASFCHQALHNAGWTKDASGCPRRATPFPSRPTQAPAPTVAVQMLGALTERSLGSARQFGETPTSSMGFVPEN
jgi:adenylate cyclase